MGSKGYCWAMTCSSCLNLGWGTGRTRKVSKEKERGHIEECHWLKSHTNLSEMPSKMKVKRLPMTSSAS